jgi:nucleoside-diphosphate-sugar epimerase
MINVKENKSDKKIKKYILITGAAGFIGSRLCKIYIHLGYSILAVDRAPVLGVPQIDDRLHVVNCDLKDAQSVDSLFIKYSINQVVHLATELNFAVKSQKELYNNNILMTDNLLRASKKYGIERFVFTSSFAIYSGIRGNSLISEDIKPYSIDEYGRSKIVCEELISNYDNIFKTVVIRCPLVVGSGRVGMLSILFDLISNDAPIVTLNGGGVKHHCVSIDDVLEVLTESLSIKNSLIFNIGCEDVKTFREIYIDLIDHSKSKSKLFNVSSYWTIPILKFLFWIKLSPLGPHQFRMLTEDCVLSLDRAKQEMIWRPRVTHFSMMRAAYDEYLSTRNFNSATSSNSKPVAAKVLKLLKILKFL